MKTFLLLSYPTFHVFVSPISIAQWYTLSMVSIESCKQQNLWDAYVLGHEGHPLQLWGWGEVKAAHGWYAERVFVSDDDEIIGAAQVLLKVLPGGFKTMAYVPRGPVCDTESRGVVLEALAQHVKTAYKAIVLTIEPHWKEFDQPKGWHHSDNTILIPHTLILDLTKTEDDLLSAIQRKRRYDIRKSTQDVPDIHEVQSREELLKCLELYKETAKRAGFALHGDSYYVDIYEQLAGHSRLIAAWNADGDPLAFTWLASSNEIAFELYSGISQEGQQLRANYALKWWCITHMQQEGIKQYDFNGLLNDGISNFKRSFAEHEDQLVGTYDRPLSVLYGVWNKGLPLAKKIVRTLKSR